VALPDARLLGEEPGREKLLPHLERERPFVAREAPRQVIEGGVVAAPLPHAVETLQDAAGHAAARIRVVVRARDRAGGLEQPEELRLERLDRFLVPRRSPESRDGLRHAQRVGGADRRSEVLHRERVTRQQMDLCAEPVDRGDGVV
jgi:hypothetical protein